MKKSLFITITLLLFSLSSFSRVFRVGYNGTPLKGVDFTSITEANDSAKVGDTIQIYGFQSGSINKRLVILGFGYKFNDHPGLQSNPGIATNEINNPSYASIYFDPGSDSSIIEGCQISTYIASNKVIIRRCYAGQVYLRDDLVSIQDFKMYSCYGMSISDYSRVGGGQHKFASKNIQIFNCAGGQLTLNSSESQSSGVLINCNDFFPYANDKPKILMKNCILNVGGSLQQFTSGNNNTIYDNNIFVYPEPTPTLPGSNNKYSQLNDSIFIPNPNPGISDENQYQLRPNSPAKDFGIDLSGKPTDCGIFGGELAYRYKIGGQPAIPAFYKLSAPTNSASSNPYNITVSVRSNN